MAHLCAYPHLAFTPWELARVLGHSHGAIRRALQHLVQTGTVVQTSQHPVRFQHHR